MPEALTCGPKNRRSLGQPASDRAFPPFEIEIWHNVKGRAGAWFGVTEQLYSANGDRRWLEHPKSPEDPAKYPRMDLVALPLSQLEHVEVIAYELEGYPEIVYGPGELASVIGFPFGRSAGFALPMWVAGFVASEPIIDWEYLPVFLIDCRSRPGQSGSPVIAHRWGSYKKEDGTMVTPGGREGVYRLLGVYSGRIQEGSDIGMVWKLSALKELIDSIK